MLQARLGQGLKTRPGALVRSLQPARPPQLAAAGSPSSHARRVAHPVQPYARFYSGQGRSQGSRKGYHSRFALIPVLLGVGGTSTLWLDSPPNTGAAADPGGSNGGVTSKHSLQSILDNVEKPDADEFLIAADAGDDDPDEDDSPPPRRLVFVRNVRHLLREYLVEPISTGLRFLHLAIIFLPVLLSAPILCLELVDDSRDRRRGRPPRTKERRTTRWWYYLLVHQMEMAGPTFIKVCRPPGLPSLTREIEKETDCLGLPFCHSSLNGQGLVPTCSRPSSATSLASCTHRASRTRSGTRNA